MSSIVAVAMKVDLMDITADDGELLNVVEDC
jgi:hypothetical protein